MSGCFLSILASGGNPLTCHVREVRVDLNPDASFAKVAGGNQRGTRSARGIADVGDDRWDDHAGSSSASDAASGKQGG
jgi:hypothetical protein